MCLPLLSGQRSDYCMSGGATAYRLLNHGLTPLLDLFGAVQVLLTATDQRGDDMSMDVDADADTDTDMAGTGTAAAPGATSGATSALINRAAGAIVSAREEPLRVMLVVAAYLGVVLSDNMVRRWFACVGVDEGRGWFFPRAVLLPSDVASHHARTVRVQRAGTHTNERRAEAARLFLSAAITSSAWLAPTPDVTAMRVLTDDGSPSRSKAAVPLSSQASVLYLLLGDTTLDSRHGLLAAVFEDVTGISLAAAVDNAPDTRLAQRTLSRANALFGNDAALVLDAAHRRAQFLANVGTPQTAASPAEAAFYAVAQHAFNDATPGSPPARRQRRCAPTDQPASDNLPGFTGDKASRRQHKRNAGLLQAAQRQAAAPADPATSNDPAPAPPGTGGKLGCICLHAHSPLTHAALHARAGAPGPWQVAQPVRARLAPRTLTTHTPGS